MDYLHVQADNPLYSFYLLLNLTNELKLNVKTRGSAEHLVILTDEFLITRTNITVHEISNNVVCATSKASDQPAHTRSLIRAFASRLSIL